MIFEGLILIGVCLVERFSLKRSGVKIISLGMEKEDDEFYRFSMRYTVKKKLRHSQVQYELRDAKRPTTVIAGKSRTLDFSGKGENDEFLLIRKSLIQDGGEWKLNVRIATAGSRWNPFYKLFPVEVSASETFHIEVNKAGEAVCE